MGDEVKWTERRKSARCESEPQRNLRKAAGMWAVGKKKKKKPKKILVAQLKKGRHVGDGDVTMI